MSHLAEAPSRYPERQGSQTHFKPINIIDFDAAKNRLGFSSVSTQPTIDTHNHHEHGHSCNHEHHDNKIQNLFSDTLARVESKKRILSVEDLIAASTRIAIVLSLPIEITTDKKNALIELQRSQGNHPYPFNKSETEISYNKKIDTIKKQTLQENTDILTNVSAHVLAKNILEEVQVPFETDDQINFLEQVHSFSDINTQKAKVLEDPDNFSYKISLDGSDMNISVTDSLRILALDLAISYSKNDLTPLQTSTIKNLATLLRNSNVTLSNFRSEDNEHIIKNNFKIPQGHSLQCLQNKIQNNETEGLQEFRKSSAEDGNVLHGKLTVDEYGKITMVDPHNHLDSIKEQMELIDAFVESKFKTSTQKEMIPQVIYKKICPTPAIDKNRLMQKDIFSNKKQKNKSDTTDIRKNVQFIRKTVVTSSQTKEKLLPVKPKKEISKRDAFDNKKAENAYDATFIKKKPLISKMFYIQRYFLENLQTADNSYSKLPKTNFYKSTSIKKQIKLEKLRNNSLNHRHSSLQAFEKSEIKISVNKSSSSATDLLKTTRSSDTTLVIRKFIGYQNKQTHPESTTKRKKSGETSEKNTPNIFLKMKVYNGTPEINKPKNPHFIVNIKKEPFQIDLVGKPKKPKNPIDKLDGREETIIQIPKNEILKQPEIVIGSSVSRAFEAYDQRATTTEKVTVETSVSHLLTTEQSTVQDQTQTTVTAKFSVEDAKASMTHSSTRVVKSHADQKQASEANSSDITEQTHEALHKVTGSKLKEQAQENGTYEARQANSSSIVSTNTQGISVTPDSVVTKSETLQSIHGESLSLQLSVPDESVLSENPFDEKAQIKGIIGKKARIIVKAAKPRRKVTVKVSMLKQIIEENKHDLGSVIYAGWTRRNIFGKRTLTYLLATGNTPKEARIRFKNGTIGSEGIFMVA